MTCIICLLARYEMCHFLKPMNKICVFDCDVIESYVVYAPPPSLIPFRQQYHRNNTLAHALLHPPFAHQFINLPLNFLSLLGMSFCRKAPRMRAMWCLIPLNGGSPVGISFGSTSLYSCKKKKKKLNTSRNNGFIRVVNNQDIILKYKKWLIGQQHLLHLVLSHQTTCFSLKWTLLLSWWCVSLFFFPFFLCVSLFSPFSYIFFFFNFIWSSQTSLGDNGLRIILFSLYMKKILFLNPSWIALVSYCHGLPNRIRLVFIGITSHSTLLAYCPMKRHTSTCLFTINSLSSLNHWCLYSLGCGLVFKFNLNTSLDLAIGTTFTINNQIAQFIIDITSNTKNVLSLGLI